MVVVSLAGTVPANPPDASVTLTVDDIWKGFVEKALRPHTGFVKPILDCTVSEHTDTIIDRHVTFAKEFQPPGLPDGPVHERIELIEGYSCLFIQDNGSKVLNQISKGKNGPDDVLVTFGFNWVHDELKEGAAAELEKMKERYQAMSWGAAESTLSKIRELKQAGKL